MLKKRKIAWLLSGALAINLMVPIVSIAAPDGMERGPSFDWLQDNPGSSPSSGNSVTGPSDTLHDLEDVEDDVDEDMQPIGKTPTKLETDTNLNADDIKKGTDINLDVGDLVVSDKVITSSGLVRVAEVYSINNNLADCYYRPEMNEIPHLDAYVLKYGQYAAAYMGFYDIGKKDPPKPSGLQSRALEIIGYDCLLSSEEYDIRSRKYRRTLAVDGAITEETAIMNIYKALGIELRDIKMYHEKANFTKENSPAAALLARDPVKYSLTIDKGSGTLRYIDVMDSYNTYVFVTRTNPELYMRKLNQDFNISMSTSKKSVVTLADFIVMCKKMMEFYGEPVMNQTEMNQLLQVYGAQIPTGLTDDLRDAWLYLKARGVLNVDDSGLFNYLTLSDMNEILMCIKDKDSRTNFKEIQVTMNIGDTLVDAGYYPDQMTFTVADKTPMEYTVDYSTAEAYDYLVPISDEYAFTGGGVTKVPTMYVSSDPNGMGTELPGSYYNGIVQNKYWHFVIPAELQRSFIKDNIYIRVETTGVTDSPDCIYLEVGGGYYKKSQKVGTSYYFIRHPFETGTYQDFVDVERKTGSTWDSSKWGVDSSTDTEIRLPSYEEEDKPTLPNVEDSDWNGIPYTFYKDATWEKEDSTGKWRLYYKDEYGNKTMAYSEIVRVGASNNLAEEIYYIDGGGYCQVGWYDWGSQYVFFNDGQIDGFKYGQMVFAVDDVTIDGEQWSFDMYGYLIGEEWDNPEEGDEWSYLNNIEGEWKKDDSGWWFMMSDGTWPTGSIEKINDKLYMFGEDGYMLTGWREWDDGNQYYFYPEDGYMARNTVTPDGYRVDLNGVPISKEVVTAFNNPAIRGLLSYIKHGFTMTAYAAGGSYGNTSGMGYSKGGRWYVLKVPLDLMETSAFDDFKGWYDNQSKTGDCKPLRKGKNENGETILIIQTKLRPEYVFSKIKYKDNSASYKMLDGVKTITSLNGSYLINFDDLVALGIFDDRAVIRDGADELILTGVQRVSNGSGEELSDTLAYGFGEVILKNKTGDKRVKVGTTIYSLPDSTEVYALGVADSDASFEYEEGQISEADASEVGMGRDSIIYGERSTQLYVDFRVAFGWATNQLDFYQCQTVANNGELSKNVIVTYGKEVPQKRCFISNIWQNPYNTMFSTVVLTGCKTASGDQAYLLPVVNNYSVASFAFVDTPLPSGGHAVMCVQYVPTCEQTKLMDKNSESDLTNLGKVSVPKFEGYTRRITNITNTNGGIQDKKQGDIVEEGKFYNYNGFGLVYCLPSYTSPQQAQGDFYSKWLNESNEYLIPLCIVNSCVRDMSVPYFPTVEYGKQPTAIAQNNSSACFPNVGGVSYLMWDKQIQNTTIASLSSSNSSKVYKYYFGGMSSEIVKKGSGSVLKISGLISSNNHSSELMSNVTDKLKFIRVDTKYMYLSLSSSGTNNIEQSQIYVTVPESIEYETVSEEAKSLTKVTLGKADAMSDVFKDFNEFTFQDLIKKIDESESFLVLFSIVVLPYIGFILSLMVFGLALCADAKPVQWFCNNVIDPIKILTFGQKDVNTVGGIRFFGCVLCITVGFALVANGNILRVLTWLFAFFAEVFRLWQML